MQLPSNKDIEKSIERAEKCLNENDLDVAERECSLAKGLIETRRANQGNDGDSDVVKLNELYGRLTGIMAKSAIERMNQGIRNEPEIELDHKYLSHKLAPIQSELYSKHRELIHKHEYEQAGNPSISERVKDILTGAAKKRSELKESLSKTGYPGVQKIINLTDTLFVETVKERREFLDKQIQQEITNLPEPYKTAVGSFFREAKKSSVEDKPTSIATEDNPVPIHTENNKTMMPDESGSEGRKKELSDILFPDINHVNQKSQSPIEWTPIDSDHEISDNNDAEREEYGSKINQLNETMVLAEKSDDGEEAEALCTWVLGQIKKISKENLNDNDAREIDILSEKAKQILQKGGAPVSGEVKLFGMNVAFKEIVQDYESGEIETKKAIEAAGRIIELLKKASLDATGTAERDRLVEQISNKMALWEQAGEQKSTGTVEPKLYCGVCGRELNSNRSCKHCTYTDVTYGHEKNLMDALLGPSWDSNSPERVGAWIIASEFSKLVKLQVISREDYPKNVADIDELLQKLSSKQLEGDAHKSLQTIYTAFVEKNGKFRNNALGTGNGGDVDSNNNHSEGQSPEDAPDEKKNLPEHKKPKLIYLPMYHVKKKDLEECGFFEQLKRLKEHDIVVVEAFYDTEKELNMSGQMYNLVAMGASIERLKIQVKNENGEISSKKLNDIMEKDEFTKTVLEALHEKAQANNGTEKVSVYHEPISKEATELMHRFDSTMKGAFNSFFKGAFDESFTLLKKTMICLADHVKIRDELTARMIVDISNRYPDKNILVLRGGGHILYEILFRKLHNHYDFENKTNEMGLVDSQLSDLTQRKIKGEDISDDEIRLKCLQSIVTNELMVLFGSGRDDKSTNQLTKEALKYSSKLDLHTLYSLSEYISQDPACQTNQIYRAKKILEFIEGKASQEAQTYNNPEEQSSNAETSAQSFQSTNTTLPFAEKETRDGVLANIYASEVLSAKGEHESAKNMLEEAEKLYKSLTNTEGFTEEMNKTTILALLYAAEILAARGYPDIAKEKIKKAEKIYHKIGKDAVFQKRMAKNDIRALMDASEILQARGFYDLAKNKVIKAENINSGLI